MLRIFIGSDVNGGCAEAILTLEYSIKKHSSGPYEIVRMLYSPDTTSPWGGWNTENWSTPFSGFRYGIAEYMKMYNLDGPTIYCDDDQIFLVDPYEILKEEIPEGKIMTGKQLKTNYGNEIRHCVSVIDHKRYNQTDFLKPNGLFETKPAKSFSNYVDYCKHSTFPLTHIIGNEWNCYDGEDMEREQIKLLHFTDMSRNPAVKLAVARLGSQANHWYDGPINQHRRPDIESIFYEYYEEALSDGFKVSDHVPSEKVSFVKGSQKGYKANNGWG